MEGGQQKTFCKSNKLRNSFVFDFLIPVFGCMEVLSMLFSGCQEEC